MSEAPPDELGPDERDADAVLLALGQHERDREAALLETRAPEWEAVVTEQLGVDEAVALRGEAGDEHVDRAAAYFRPFDADESAALLGGLLAAAETEVPSNVVPLVEREAPSPAPRSRGSGWISGGLLVAAAAAAIVLWWVWPSNPDGGEDGTTLAQREPLPSYVLETDGGLTQLRGDTGAEDVAAPHRYRRDTPFEWVLRPEASVGGEVGVRGFVVAGDGGAGRPLRLEALVRIAKSGAIQITGTIGQLELEPGSYTIALVVGRLDELPARAADAVAPGPDGAPTPWALRQVEIVIDE